MKRLVIVLAALVLGSGVGVLAQSPADTGSGARPYVEFRIVKSGEVTPGVTVGGDLKPGSAAAAVFTARESLCQMTFGSEGRPLPADARTVVRLSAELLDQKDGAYSVRLASHHVRTAGRPGSESPFEQVVSLRDGDRVALDMLRDAAPVPGCDTSAITLEARLLVRLDPAVARTIFAVDLWFVHRDETGREWNQHLTTNVNGAVDMPFLFDDVTFPLPKLDPSQDLFTAYVRLTGTLRARARTDGLVDLDYSTARTIGLLLPSNPPGVSGTSARKSITVKPDETTAIEIPQPGSGFVMTALRIGGKISGSGTVGARPSGSGDSLATQPKVFISNGAFVLNTGVFFKSHVTRLLIRVHRAQEAGPLGQ
jgi:hypothetical protein